MLRHGCRHATMASPAFDVRMHLLRARRQTTRWIMTKEDHAKSIITTVSEYMLAQRVKKELFESEGDYKDALVAHHVLMQAAVKTKQVIDVAACDALDHAIADVGAMYTKK